MSASCIRCDKETTRAPLFRVARMSQSACRLSVVFLTTGILLAVAAPATLAADQYQFGNAPEGMRRSIIVGYDEAHRSRRAAEYFRSYRIVITPRASFDATLASIRRSLRTVPHDIVLIDRDTRNVVVAMYPDDMHVLDRVPTIRRVVMLEGESRRQRRKHVEEAPPPPRFPGPAPEPRRQAQPMTTHRVIVQFNPSSDRQGEINRILDALSGVPYKVARTFEYSPSIVLEVDQEGLERLRRLPGVTVQKDGLSRPT